VKTKGTSKIAIEGVACLRCALISSQYILYVKEASLHFYLTSCPHIISHVFDASILSGTSELTSDYMFYQNRKKKP
jgi:hypothetical protein